MVAEALIYYEAQPPLEALRPKRPGDQKRRLGRNLALRLRNRRESALCFLHKSAIQFIHNQAEQDMRMIKVRQQTSGGFRSARRARDFATPRSVLSSVRKQGRSRLEALLQGLEVLFAALPP